MDEDTKRELDTQNKRIRRAADRMPTPGLAKTFKAIGYRFDLALSNDYCVVIHDFSMKTIADLSRGKPYQRSERALQYDLDVLVSCDVALVTRGPQRDDGKHPAHRITLYLHKEVPAGVVEEARERRRASRKPKVIEVPMPEAEEHDPWCEDECCTHPSHERPGEMAEASGQEGMLHLVPANVAP